MENTGPTAPAGLAIAEHVVGKAEARSKIFPAGLDPIFRNSWVAREVHSWWSIGELCGTDTGNQTAEPKLFNTPFDFAPRQTRLITQPTVHRQAPADLGAVLSVHIGLYA